MRKSWDFIDYMVDVAVWSVFYYYVSHIEK